MNVTAQGQSHLHRLILFSDAVFAIAITLLAIEIHPPEHWATIGQLWSLMAEKLLAYAISFAVIGVYWVSHRRIFARLAHANGILDTLNFGVLGLVALVPLGTELLWEQTARQAYPIYIGLVTLIGVAMALLWGYAAFVGGLAKPIARIEALLIMGRVAVLPGLVCGLSFFSMARPWGLALMAGALIGFVVLGRCINNRSTVAS